jgi:hypothetical protein
MAADPHIRPRGLWDQLGRNILPQNSVRIFSYGDRGNVFLRNVGTHAPGYKTVHSRRLKCEINVNTQYINKCIFRVIVK